MIAMVRKVLQEHGGLHTPVDTLASDADLYAAGLTPFAAPASLQSSTLSRRRAPSSRAGIAEQCEDLGETPMIDLQPIQNLCLAGAALFATNIVVATAEMLWALWP